MHYHAKFHDNRLHRRRGWKNHRKLNILRYAIGLAYSPYLQVATQYLWPGSCQISNSTRFLKWQAYVFPQDSAPAHRARDMIDCIAATRNDEFHTSDRLWPPNSPDLNPVDYCVWEFQRLCSLHSSVGINVLIIIIIIFWPSVDIFPRDLKCKR